MANNDNLKKGNPATEFSSGREAVEKGKKGGKKSAEVRAETKDFIKKMEVAIDLYTKRSIKKAIECDNKDEANELKESGLVVIELMSL